MNKRNFPRGLLAALAAGIAAHTAAGPRKRVLSQVSPLAGFERHAGEEIRPRVATDQPLSLVREPGNAFHIAVQIDGPGPSSAICRAWMTPRWRRCGIAGKGCARRSRSFGPPRNCGTG